MDKPQSAINQVCASGSVFYKSKPEWKRNGRSWSCGYCGSMSTEELRECLDAVPQLSFELNDWHDKVYVNRYNHAGDCIDEKDAYCCCDTKRGGGPIKFRINHISDLPDDAGRQALYARLMVACNRSHREFMARFMCTDSQERD